MTSIMTKVPVASGFAWEQILLKSYSTGVVGVKYRDTSDANSNVVQITADKLKFDITQNFDEQIIAGSVRFKAGVDTFIDRAGTLYRSVNPTNNSGILAGQIQYASGVVEIDSWTPNADNSLTLESLTTTVDLPLINQISFRIPVIPIRPQSLTVVVATLEFGQLTLSANENGNIANALATGFINYETGFVDISFFKKTEITAINRPEIETQNWYDVVMEYQEEGKTFINTPVWVSPDTIRYNAIAYTYIPLSADVLGLSATRLPVDGRVPIFRVGGIGIISSTKSQELPGTIAGTIFELNDQRISWCELEDANGVKIPFESYVVDYDYGKVTLGGDFVMGNLTAPIIARYRYQDMGLIRDVQINGQVTFSKPITHNYQADETIVGSALIVDDLQARYTNKFVQYSWSSIWSDEATGAAISANYNDMLYPVQVTNKGAMQERWAIIFTNTTNFRCVGEYSGEIATGSVNSDFSPINPVTKAPYFIVKKEGWGSGWVAGNTLRFNTIAASAPVWVIRTVKISEPTVLSDQFQIMMRGDIDRVV